MPDVKRQLEEYVRLLEQALPGYIDQAETPYRRVHDAMAYSLLSGGKRIRGVLVLAFYRLFHDDVHPALPFAAALEMVHAYSLIHDDLPCMDNSELRRGKPACHIAYDEATALLAGDGLLTLAFETMSNPRHTQPFGAGQVLHAVRLLSSAAGGNGMIGGQMLDLLNENTPMTDEQLRFLDGKKTGALIAAAAQTGCVLAGASEQDLHIAGQYAQNVGLAFQIVDDVLDAVGDAGLLGKPVNRDGANNKCTYLTLHGEEACRRMAQQLARQAKEALAQTGRDTEFLCALADMLACRQF